MNYFFIRLMVFMQAFKRKKCFCYFASAIYYTADSEDIDRKKKEGYDKGVELNIAIIWGVVLPQSHWTPSIYLHVSMYLGIWRSGHNVKFIFKLDPNSHNILLRSPISSYCQYEQSERIKVLLPVCVWEAFIWHIQLLCMRVCVALGCYCVHTCVYYDVYV